MKQSEAKRALEEWPNLKKQVGLTLRAIEAIPWWMRVALYWGCFRSGMTPHALATLTRAKGLDGFYADIAKLSPLVRTGWCGGLDAPILVCHPDQFGVDHVFLLYNQKGHLRNPEYTWAAPVRIYDPLSKSRRVNVGASPPKRHADFFKAYPWPKFTGIGPNRRTYVGGQTGVSKIVSRAIADRLKTSIEPLFPVLIHQMGTDFVPLWRAGYDA